MNEIHDETFLKTLQNHLINRQIQVINELWEVIANSKNQNSENILDSLEIQLDYSARYIHKDILLVENLKKYNDYYSWRNILEDNNISENFIAPSDWINLFIKNNPKTDSKNISVQTNDIKIHTSEISTQTSPILTMTKNVQTKENSSEISTQSSTVKNFTENSKNKDNSTKSNTINENKKLNNHLSYAAASKLKSTQIKSDLTTNISLNNNTEKSPKIKREIYNVQTNNRFNILSCNNNQQNRTTNHITGTQTRNNVAHKMSAKGTPNPNVPSQKRNALGQNHPSSMGKHQQGKPTTNFNSRGSKFIAEVHSPSLQRNKWHGKSRNFKESPINNINPCKYSNQNYSKETTSSKFHNNSKSRNFNPSPMENFNSNKKCQRYSNQNNMREFKRTRNNSNPRNSFENIAFGNNSFKNQFFKHDTFGNNLPLILTNLFMQWINSNFNSNHINIKKKSYYNYENMKNRNFKPYEKIII